MSGRAGQGRVRAARAGQRNHLFRLQPDRRVLGAPALTTRTGRVGDGGHVRLHGITVVSHLLRRVAGSKRSHRTPLVFSRSQNAARLMAGEGRIELFGGYDSNGRSRRISPVPVRPGEGPLTERTAGVQATRREQVFMPRTCRSSPLRRTSGRLRREGFERRNSSLARRTHRSLAASRSGERRGLVPRRHEPRPPVGRAGPAGRGARAARARVRLVH